MRIVVTGAAGFIGSHTCERLCAAGHIVHGVDSFDSFLYGEEPKRANATHLASTLSPELFSMSELDICDRPAIDRAFAAFKPDRLCHLARVLHGR